MLFDQFKIYVNICKTKCHPEKTLRVNNATEYINFEFQEYLRTNKIRIEPIAHTPFEIRIGKKSLDHVRVFGSEACMLIQDAR